MPPKTKLPKTKLHRSGKLAGLRRVYVSWLEPSEPRRAWIDAFWESLQLASAQKDELFVGVMRTGDADPGAILSEWLDPKKKRDPITDVVGVLTTKYLYHNTDIGGVPSQGELARFFDRVFALDVEERVRIFLAPVDPPNWRYRIRRIPLNHDSLTRLRDERFTWPGEPNCAAKSAEEIDKAVKMIVGTPED
jgi:hypothetical protein